MNTAEKHIKRGYRRNFATIQAMIAEYQKATGKVATQQNLHVKTDPSNSTQKAAGLPS